MGKFGTGGIALGVSAETPKGIMIRGGSGGKEGFVSGVHGHKGAGAPTDRWRNSQHFPFVLQTGSGWRHP